MLLKLEEKRFAGGGAVLGNLQLELGEGEFLALLGPSGAGKTTLLRILAGLDTKFSGALEHHGTSPRLGYLFQEARLMPWLTARQNVSLVVDGDTDRASAALESVGLAEAAQRYPHQLSGGMQRRVALARALVGEPQLLLLDEPFVSLDQPNAAELRSQLLAYWQRARPTIVLVSHDLREALTLADRVCFLGGSPAGLVHEVRPSMEHPRDPDGMALRELFERLLVEHPRLLSGELGEGL
ncbi:MAG: ABC transporter ATP-binding protein [Pseudomonadota bacterium]